DLKIISSLGEDARKTVTQLAKETGLSRPTVTNRLSGMIKQNTLRITAGLNIKKLGFPIAYVSLETRGADLRQKVERNLLNCPRVLMILRPSEKANLSVLLFGEDQRALRSTIESLRDFTGADLVDVHYSEPPSFPEHFHIRVFPEKSDTAPCGRKCVDCIRYKNVQCVGCPMVTEYKGPL
ncbi:MAG: AsnC family transcriptional regulator, partial [Candidatus Bathyarchaeia archaeon]